MDAPQALDLRSEKSEAMEKPPAPAERLSRTPTLLIQYMGKEGRIEATVPGGSVRNQIARLSASWANGVPWESLAPLDRMRFHSLAYLTCVVNVDEAPEWFIEAIQEDDEFLAEVYEGVTTYVDRYFRIDPKSRTAGTRVTRVVVEAAGS